MKKIQTICGAACAGMVLLAVKGEAQTLVVSSLSQNAIYEITAGGRKTTFATLIVEPRAMVFNSAGNLFVLSGTSIIEFSPNGSRSTFATGLSDIGGLAFDSAGDLFVSDFNVTGSLPGSIVEITPDGTKSTFATGLFGPRGLAFNTSGDLFVGTRTNITEITPAGVESVFVPGLDDVNNLAFNNGGYLFAESGTNIDIVSPEGTVAPFASVPADSGEMAFSSKGNLFSEDNLYVANQNGSDILEFNANGEESVFYSGISDPQGLVFAVPEPSVFGLAGASIAVFLSSRRRVTRKNFTRDASECRTICGGILQFPIKR